MGAEAAFPAVGAEAEDLGGDRILAFSLEKKRPAKEISMKRKTEVNSDFSF